MTSSPRGERRLEFRLCFSFNSVARVARYWLSFFQARFLACSFPEVGKFRNTTSLMTEISDFPREFFLKRKKRRLSRSNALIIQRLCTDTGER